MRSVSATRNTSTSRMKAKYCAPTSMSKLAPRMRLSICCATRQTMNAIALACSASPLRSPALNQRLLMRIVGKVVTP